MSYNVAVNGNRATVSSFASAVATVRENAVKVAERLSTVNEGNFRRLYRSAKVATRLLNDRARSASNVVKNLKLPAKAGSYNGSNNSLNWSIEKVG